MARPCLVPRLSLGFAAFFAIGALQATASAAGFDTPILYSARHMGMGGTAIGYVNDPASMFHNPAGLNGVRGVDMLLDVSPLYGAITSSPGQGSADGAGNFPTQTTEKAISPLFMAAAAYRFWEPMTFGIGVYPVAAAAGEYRGTSPIGNPTIDKTRIVFMEVSPALSIQLAPRLSLGVGYRVTMASLERVKGDEANPREFNFTVKGTDATGFRAGLQWQVNDNFGVGAVYRHRIEPKLHADTGWALRELQDPETSLVLPSKFGIGAHGRMDRLHGALDFEYSLTSQNTTTVLSGFNVALNKREQVVNYFMWQDALTARLGLEYLLGDSKNVAVRAGYIFDGKVGNKAYPTAFGTPPAPSHSITAGAGYLGEKWQTNLGVAYRFASTSITAADVAGAEPCPSCAKPGTDYNLKILGLYLDFSYKFDVAPVIPGGWGQNWAPGGAAPNAEPPTAPPPPAAASTPASPVAPTAEPAAPAPAQ